MRGAAVRQRYKDGAEGTMRSVRAGVHSIEHGSRCKMQRTADSRQPKAES